MTYRVELIHSEEGYAVACPDLPGCASHGETEEEAINNIREAISEYIAVPNGHQAEQMPVREIRFVDVPANGNTASTKPDRTPFKVVPIMNSLPPEWTSHKVEDLLDILEGPERR